MPTNYYQWNWGDAPSVVAHLHHLPSRQRQMLEDRQETIRRFAWRFARAGQDCLGDAVVLVLAGHTGAADLCACGLRYPGRRCTLWSVCQYCGFVKERGLFNRYRPAGRLWRQGVTVTVRPHVARTDRIEADLSVLMEYWDMLHRATYDLVRDGKLDGIFWGEHFIPHFHSYGRSGAFAWPHLHGYALVAAGVTAAEVTSADGSVAVFCEPVASEVHAKNILDYVIATPPWAAAYAEAWLAVGAEVGTGVAVALNEAVRDVVGCFEDAAASRRKTRAAGVMHHAHRRYVGATADEMRRPGYGAATKAWLSELGTRSEADQSDD